MSPRTVGNGDERRTSHARDPSLATMANSMRRWTMGGAARFAMAIWLCWTDGTAATLAKGRTSSPVRPRDWSYSQVEDAVVQSQWEEHDVAEMVNEEGRRIATFVDVPNLNRTVLQAMAVHEDSSLAFQGSSRRSDDIRVFLNGGPFLSLNASDFMPMISKTAKKLCKGKIKMIVEEQYIPGDRIPGEWVEGHWKPKQTVPGYVVPPTVLEGKRCYETEYEKGEWVPREYVEGRKSGEFEFVDSVYEAGQLIEGKKVEKSIETLDNGQVKVTPGYYQKPSWAPGTWIAGHYQQPSVVAPHVLRKNYVGGHFTKGYCKPEVKTKRHRVRDDYYRAKFIPGHYIRPTWSPPQYIPRKYVCAMEVQQKETQPKYNRTVSPKLHGCGASC